MSGKAKEVLVLGIAQDAGYPSPGCRRECCSAEAVATCGVHYPACLAILDGQGGRWMIDCTPAFGQQLALLDSHCPAPQDGPLLDGIFLTHAHIGHYTGLMFLGREVIGASGLTVHAMPRMRAFLESNAPWDQLVRIGNISLSALTSTRQELSPGLWIQALSVPHRAEYSETVAFRVSTDSASLLYLPDIDRWEDLDPSIEDLIRSNDIVLLDATFHSGNELPGRDMREIPHPCVEHSLQRFAGLPIELRGRIHFFHFNHTNPLLNAASMESRQLAELGYRSVREGQIFRL